MARNRPRSTKPKTRRDSCRLEPLEPRRLLAADPVISEFMPDNDGFLLDSDGDFPDWIEISNQGDESIDLGGWHLTDDSGNLDKWQFPATTLDAGESMVVFASGKNRAVSGSELHTDFKLATDGEAVLLVQPDGMTVTSEFSPYPFVPENVSYGSGLVLLNQGLIGDSADTTLLVPSTANGGDQLGTSWIETTFDDASWTNVQTSIGYGGGDLTIPKTLHWTLDETGIVLFDASGNGNIALKFTPKTNTTDVAPIPSGSAASLEFDGVDDDIVASAYSGILADAARSVSTWIKTTKDPATGVYAPRWCIGAVVETVAGLRFASTRIPVTEPLAPCASK